MTRARGRLSRFLDTILTCCRFRLAACGIAIFGGPHSQHFAHRAGKTVHSLLVGRPIMFGFGLLHGSLLHGRTGLIGRKDGGVWSIGYNSLKEASCLQTVPRPPHRTTSSSSTTWTVRLLGIGTLLGPAMDRMRGRTGAESALGRAPPARQRFPLTRLSNVVAYAYRLSTQETRRYVPVNFRGPYTVRKNSRSSRGPQAQYRVAAFAFRLPNGVAEKLRELLSRVTKNSVIPTGAKRSGGTCSCAASTRGGPSATPPLVRLRSG
jgi:hypothetical protein